MKKVGWLLSVIVLVVSMFSGALNSQADDPIFQYQFLRTGKKLTINRSSLILDDSLDNKLESIEITLPQDVKLLVDTPNGWEKMESNGSVTYVLKSNKKIDDICNFLSSLVFEVNTEKTAQIGINLNTTRIVPRDHEDGTTHYYKFVPGNYDWYTSYNLAKQETYNGLKGYLMTVTSKEENEFITSSLDMYPGWLGGTRHKNKDKTKINDVDTVIGNYKEYDYSEDEWYWANGPEAGEVFSKGKTGQVSIPGAYSKWATGEPNNAMGYSGEPKDSEEAALQWGINVKEGTWNDLSPTFTFSPNWIQGYFVEFSEYNGQVVTPEVNKGASNVAKIPQKVSLKFYDTDDNLLPAKEIVLEEDLVIGQTYDFTSQLPNIPGYEIDLSRSTGITGTITDQVINAKAVYRSSAISEDSDAEIKLSEDTGSVKFVNVNTTATMEFEDVTLNGNQQTVGEKSTQSHIQINDSRKNRTKGWSVFGKCKTDNFTTKGLSINLNTDSVNALFLFPLLLTTDNQLVAYSPGNNIEDDFEIVLNPTIKVPATFDQVGTYNETIQWDLIPDV